MTSRFTMSNSLPHADNSSVTYQVSKREAAQQESEPMGVAVLLDV